MLNDHIENLRDEWDDKIARALKIVDYLKRQEDTDAWELGMAEGQLLTLEFCRRKLEMDDTTSGDMFEATMERLIFARE